MRDRVFLRLHLKEGYEDSKTSIGMLFHTKGVFTKNECLNASTLECMHCNSLEW